jgi:hypothetical protein
MKMLISSALAAAGVLLPVLFRAAGAEEPAQGVTRVPVVFSGGHETDPQDRGRPVVLVAAGLGVPPEVFREAFKQVRPAPAGTKPSRDQERRNKTVLLKALGKYGVTNERLDTVSDYYRYVPGRGRLWTVKPAVANALVRDGKVIGYEVVEGGSGYSSPPEITVPNVRSAPARVELSFGKNLEKNGSIAAITIPKAE